MGKLREMESEKAKLKSGLSTLTQSEPIFHPNLARLYREKVIDLHAALSRPETRTEAADILRNLIKRIDIRFIDNQPIAELIGDIVNLVTLPEGSDVPEMFNSSVKVVAGARCHRDFSCWC